MFRTEWQIHTNGKFYYPSNVTHFLWLYQSSKFLSCNRVLADRMVKQYQLHQDGNQWNLTVEPMRYIAQSLDTLEKRYWLAGGTLLGRRMLMIKKSELLKLGWYRHCGLIPFTSDVDFGLFAEQYDESIREHFLGNAKVYLWGALGLVKVHWLVLHFMLFNQQAYSLGERFVRISSLYWTIHVRSLLGLSWRWSSMVRLPGATNKISVCHALFPPSFVWKVRFLNSLQTNVASATWTVLSGSVRLPFFRSMFARWISK